MRLPQSSSPAVSISLPIRLVSLALLIAFIALLPVSSRAAAPQLVCTPSKLRFGAVTVGQSETQLMVLTNTGTTSTTVSTITLGGTEFRVSGIVLPVSLAAGESVTLNVKFAPTATGWTGWTEGEITFTGKVSNPSIRLWLGGSGVSNELLTATPLSLSFGKTPVGTSTTLPIVLTNSHAHAQTLQSFQATGSEFSISGPSVPMSIAPGRALR